MTEHNQRVQSKMLIAGLVVAVAAVWLLLSWEPVAREHEESSPSAATTAPTPEPEVAPAAAPPTVKAPPAAAQAPAHAEQPAPAEPSEDEVQYERTASGEIKSNMKLERIPDEALDPNNMQPPASSGPLAELEKEFEGSARDANSSSLEATVEAAFRGPNVPKELFDSVVCHGSVCRARTRWTRERASGFMLGMMTLTAKTPDRPDGPMPFSKDFAIGKAADRNTNGEREIDVYFRKLGDPQK